MADSRNLYIQFLRPDTQQPELAGVSLDELLAIRIAGEWCSALTGRHPFAIPPYLIAGTAFYLFGPKPDNPTPKKALAHLEKSGHVLSFEALEENTFRVTIPTDIFTRPDPKPPEIQPPCPP